MEFYITDINEDIREKVNNILIEEWESTNIVVRGNIIDGTKLDGFVAVSNEQIVGLVTYVFKDTECEIISLNSFIENIGIGTALINKVREIAKNNNCHILKLVTTNNNIKAFGFYQKRGFIISKVYINAMETARKLKPQIPMVDENNLPIRDEIEFIINF